MASFQEILAAMHEVAPEGLEVLAEEQLAELRGLTEALAAATDGATEEHARYLAIRQRGIRNTGANLCGWLRGKTVLITGGTGCIGSALAAQAASGFPRRLVAVSRGITNGWPRSQGVEYVQSDIRDAAGLDEVFRRIRPNVVFHLAAQRDPGLAERTVHRTVTTNLFGARNVLSSAERYGASQVIIASTGKALRPYARDVYCASKRAAEWLVSQAAARGGACYSAARFTHVVDNSIVYSRLLTWCGDGVIRLHSPDAAFYAQSARESAELLLLAGQSACGRHFPVQALTDLGLPFRLVDLALGVRMRLTSAAPIYFSGYDPGYERTVFPGLYDPVTAGDVSPLLSAFEAFNARRTCEGPADFFPLELRTGPADEALLRELEETCHSTREPAPIRAALERLSWALLDASLACVPQETLLRVAHITAPHRDLLEADQLRLLHAVERHAAGAA